VNDLIACLSRREIDEIVLCDIRAGRMATSRHSGQKPIEVPEHRLDVEVAIDSHVVPGILSIIRPKILSDS
jgi:hypothetical protein